MYQTVTIRIKLLPTNKQASTNDSRNIINDVVQGEISSYGNLSLVVTRIVD